MPRTARVAPKENVFHVLTRGNNRQDIFNDDEDFRKYIELLLKYKEKYKFKLYHYVLMTNHVHLVLETTEKGGNLADIMKGINLSYAKHYKRTYDHVGHFWQDRYKSILISKDDHLLACAGYVELNPVRAGMVEDPKHYKWSSYNVHAYGTADLLNLVDEHPLYSLPSKNKIEKRKRYREFLKEMLQKRYSMKDEMNRRLVYGSADFKKKVADKYKVNETIRSVGRPNSKERMEKE